MGDAVALTALTALTKAMRCCALPALLLLPLSAWSADDVPTAGPARCRFAVPPGWSASALRWSGACRGGLAHGPGVLREYDGAKVNQAFYGGLRAGTLGLGVIEQPGGFVAGRFELGRVVGDDNRNTAIRAFDAAAVAARQLAERYRRAGNVASARFYGDKAKQLAEQLD